MTNEELERCIERHDGYVMVVRPFVLHGVFIRSGFISNGASRPFGDRLAVPYVYEAVYHDYVYVTHEHTRWQADLNYASGLVSRGVSVREALVHLIGLRLFGWIYW